eukprot:4311988-Alexandrium_andersonii.AAC.1
MEGEEELAEHEDQQEEEASQLVYEGGDERHVERVEGVVIDALRLPGGTAGSCNRSAHAPVEIEEQCRLWMLCEWMNTSTRASSRCKSPFHSIHEPT